MIQRTSLLRLQLFGSICCNKDGCLSEVPAGPPEARVKSIVLPAARTDNVSDLLPKSSRKLNVLLEVDAVWRHLASFKST